MGMQFMHMFFAHLLLDYPLQGEFLAIQKKNYNFLLVVHCGIWAIGHFFMLNYMGIFEMWMFWWLFLGHLAMDYVKCHFLKGWCVAWWASRSKDDTPKWVSDELCMPLWIDQGFHVIQIGVCLL